MSFSKYPIRQVVLFSLGIAILIYSITLIIFVCRSRDIGLRCGFDRALVETPAENLYVYSQPSPERGDKVVQIGPQAISNFADLLLALESLPSPGQPVQVRFLRPGSPAELLSSVPVRRAPLQSVSWSLLWFLQEMVIFVIGAMVYWKRPTDDSAALFFGLCIVTVGAFLGGYHWYEIAGSGPLIMVFPVCVMLVPVMSLHFFLIFPRTNPFVRQHPRLTLFVLYSVPTVSILAIWTPMALLMHFHQGKLSDPPVVEVLLRLMRWVAVAYAGFTAIIFGLCVWCLRHSYRSSRTRAERNQVKWIFFGALLATPFLGWSIYSALTTGFAGFVLKDAMLPLFMTSLLFTIGYALSITRYKLMHVEEIISRVRLYFGISFLLGISYYGVVAAFTLLMVDHLAPSKQGLLVGLTTILCLVVLGWLRDRSQRAIDRRFYAEKSKLDQAMRRMSQAVGNLVDPETLARRMLEAAVEVLGLERASIYLLSGQDGVYRLAAFLGPEPAAAALAPDSPLPLGLSRNPFVPARSFHLAPLPYAAGPTTDSAARQLQQLGGELARRLEGEGSMVGVVVLGPKRTKAPYEPEDLTFLNALSSVTTLAVSSAQGHQTIEALNRELQGKVAKIAEQQRRILVLQNQLMSQQPAPDRAAEPAAFRVDEIKGNSPAVQQMLVMVRKVSASQSAVLVRGESGTGKELLARAIHFNSPRAGGPFVKVHCAALAPGLLESELFGHVKGAFTGADREKVGRFELADGGTLFLDEIGDINLETQTKLLRVLQEMAFERVGSSHTIRVDVRMIAATHQPLEELIRQGKFREDLFYRLNVISIRTPPLRERREDIFELAMYFLGKFARETGKSITQIEEDAVDALVAYDWPGNIREMENMIERAIVLADGPSLVLADLPPELTSRLAHRAPARPRPAPPRAAKPNGQPLGALAQWERERLEQALVAAGGNKAVAARQLGLPRSTFLSRLKRCGLA